MTAAERALLEGILADMHQQFVKDVAENRELPEEDVRKVADGRPMTGRAALEHKLIDALGGEAEAIQKAAELAGIKGEPQIHRVKAGPPWWEELLFETMNSLVKKVVGTIGDVAHY
jgi:protease-4